MLHLEKVCQMLNLFALYNGFLRQFVRVSILLSRSNVIAPPQSFTDVILWVIGEMISPGAAIDV